MKYASRYDSLEANAKLLRNGLTWDSGYYSGTWKSKAKTYADAANALTGKYATDPSYGSKLINIIKTYNLTELDKPAKTGYFQDSDGQWYWFESGVKYTGFRFYMGTYYWFVNGVRQNEGWREAWGYKYWTNKEGRAVQGWQTINGQRYYFGNDGTYYLR